MLERAQQGANEGLWLRAERQTGGRGRLARPWQSPPGNLYASTLVRLRPSDPPAHSLAFVAALAAFDSIAPYLETAADNRPMLKWPNDILVDGAKLSGILLERQADAVVVGFGINIAAAPDIPGRSVICLHDAGGPSSLTADMLITSIAAIFADRLALWRGGGLATLLARWCDHAHMQGSELAVTLANGEMIHGQFDGLEADGALRLRAGGGQTVVVTAGDVELVRPMQPL